MIQYLLAEDDLPLRQALGLFLQLNIETDFGAAQGTICKEVNEALKEIKNIGPALNLIVLDMDFKGHIVGGGFRILDELKHLQQLSTVVVYSAQLGRLIPPENRTLREELATSYEIPPERIIDKLKGTRVLWPACANILNQR